ncbi:MAG: MarR family transcriptional regulator [Acidimicrobiia bacterium]|nr:MarR family transcriptional regulator [Acidimicrobiia bacterium]
MGQEQPLWRRAASHTLHTSFLIKARLEEALQAETDLLLADNEALLNLSHAEEPLRMSDIAHRLILSPGGTTKVIDRLERMGYVTRRPDPDDRRATMVEITTEGSEVLARAQQVINAGLEETWARHMSDDEARTLIEVMDRVLGDHHQT